MAPAERFAISPGFSQISASAVKFLGRQSSLTENTLSKRHANLCGRHESNYWNNGSAYQCDIEAARPPRFDRWHKFVHSHKYCPALTF
jgi:hypothetical protein